MVPSEQERSDNGREHEPGEVREAGARYRSEGLEIVDDPALIQEIVSRIIDAVSPDRIILFGSAARGESGPDSDLDLLVIKTDIDHRGRLEEEVYMSLLGVAASVDVIVATPEDVERFRDEVGSVIGPALREGREIYALS